MTLTAANPGGWSLNEVLTSAQMTHLQNQLLNAIDGVNGGTYTLASTLTFMGQDVRIGADLEVISGGELNVNNGATGTIDGDLTFGSNSDTTFGSGANVLLGGGAVLEIVGDMNVTSGGNVNVDTGARLDINTGAEMNIEGTGFLDVSGTINIITGGFLRIKSSGDLRVEGGGDLVFEGTGGGGVALFQGGGSHATFQAGSYLQVEDAEDVVINDAPEGFRTTLMPFGFIATGWESRITSEILWEQVDVSSDYRIVFPIVVPPGDDLVDVFIGLNGENGHADLPATMPRARLVRAALDGTFTVLATRIDPAASVGAYETPHYLVLGAGSLDSGTMPQTATADPLYVIVQGEAGANSLAGLEIGSITGNRIARSYRGGNAVFT